MIDLPFAHVRLLRLLAAALALVPLAACARAGCCPRRPAYALTPFGSETAAISRGASAPAPDPSTSTPPVARTEAAYTPTGLPTSLDAVVRELDAGNADVVAFGELHGHPVGAAWELGLLRSLAALDRPVALAMEFLERDVQASVDAYLAGRIDEATLAKDARQSAAFATTHLPLLVFAAKHHIPVLAANAPRPLVTRFRKSSDAYPTWRASLAADEQVLVPREHSMPDDPYYARFLDLMGAERGPTFFRAQALWDDAMAETIADFRTARPDHRVLFIVGAFHVTGGLGTMTKLAQRRPGDVARTIVMTHSVDPSLAFDEADRALGDTVLKVPAPGA